MAEMAEYVRSRGCHILAYLPLPTAWADTVAQPEAVYCSGKIQEKQPRQPAYGLPKEEEPAGGIQPLQRYVVRGVWVVQRRSRSLVYCIVLLPCRRRHDARSALDSQVGNRGNDITTTVFGNWLVCHALESRTSEMVDHVPSDALSLVRIRKPSRPRLDPRRQESAGRALECVCRCYATLSDEAVSAC